MVSFPQVLGSIFTTHRPIRLVYDVSPFFLVELCLLCKTLMHQRIRSWHHLLTSNLGETALPSPTANLTLKAITLGRGTQNYTCAPGSTGAPAAVGAIAELLDASALLPLLPPRRGMQILNLLPSYLVSLSSAAVGNASIPIIGRHYFDATGVPTFDLGSTGLLRGGVAASIPAPANASRGPDNQGVGAVTWLDLADVGGSRGLSQGYRVETAGGRQPVSCSGQPEDIEVQYAAQYWFYG